MLRKSKAVLTERVQMRVLDGFRVTDGSSMARPTPKLLLPAGRTAKLRHLQYSEDMQCWTVRCGKCGEDLPCDGEFYSADSQYSHLPAAWCKACRAERCHSWYRRRGAAMRKACRKAQAASAIGVVHG